MGAISAARDAGQALVRNPVVFLATFGLALVQVPQQALQFFGLNVAGSLYGLATVVVTPLFTAGILSMAHEALDESTGLSTFVEGGKEHYLTMLLSTLLYSAVFAAIGFVTAFVLIIAGVFVIGLSAAGTGGVSMVSLGIVGVLVLLAVAVFFVLSMLLQFFSPAIVVDDADIGESFKRSYRLARENLVSVFGFTVLKAIPGTLAGGSVVLLLFARYYREFSRGGFGENPAMAESLFVNGSVYGGLETATFAAIVLVGIASTTLVTAFTQTYLLTYYVEHADAEPSGTQRFEEEYDLPSGY
ncbi:DUF7847 domain-containing protein [Haloarchaeobius amylolyticus]|uniref:DUF7847 domain-containing protein n=1 Tax=Haloarchaeobius amylolyticus TaxID=1198296 RepID=UPI00226E1AA3|nr:hypothetical protein [Haloarchaeobius amylolyticus]